MKTALILIGLGLQMKQSLFKSCRHVQAACALFRRAEEQRIRPGDGCVIRRVTPQPGVDCLVGPSWNGRRLFKPRSPSGARFSARALRLRHRPAGS